MFPDYNRWSLPLLILVFQGLIFVVLLFIRYLKKRNLSELFLALILFLTCYSQTCYTIGFMDWYDTFKTTKINYFLINTGIAIGPLIYLYVKSVTTSNFKFKKHYWLHFLFFFIVIIYKISIYTYDASQNGFNEVQNGFLKLNLDEVYISPILGVLSPAFILVYLAFTFQLFYSYRKKIIQFFSNTYALELNWILSFLILFSLAFLYGIIQDFIGSYFVNLNYMERWWLNLFVAIITLYVGVKGYFTDTTKLNTLDFTFSPKAIGIPDSTDSITENKSIPEIQINNIKLLMETNKPYLNPDLNLSELAQLANLSRGQLSETINSGFNKNFNDFINAYRVEAFKKMIQENKQEQLSLLGIAQDCGFNSKATFNRVFKKLTSLSPTQYLQTQVN